VSGHGSLPLRVVDGLTLPADVRAALRPGTLMADREGRTRRLPRWFYEVESWDQALELPLAPHFTLWEFIAVDVREAEPQRAFPRWVPCAVTLLAAGLEVLRGAVGTYIHIAANGGYRTPGHALSTHASLHCWATAANIHRIGDDDLDTPARIERYARVVADVLPGAWLRPAGNGVGEADDHLHLDLGYVTVVPRAAPSAGEAQGNGAP
jgi:hypothetical protein